MPDPGTTNDADAGQNQPGTGATAGGDQENKAQPTILKVYGKDVELKANVTGDERDRILELAQKGAAADQRMQENATEKQRLSEERTALQGDIALGDAVRRLRESDGTDADAFGVIADAFGLSDEQTAAFLDSNDPGKAPGSQKTANSGGAPGSPTSSPQRPLTFKELPKDAQDELKASFQERFSRDVRKFVASDKELGENVREGDKRSDAIVGMVEDAAKRLMLVGKPGPGGVTRQRPYGPDVLSEAVAEVRQLTQSLGIQGGDGQLPAGSRQAGAGRAPMGGPATHQPTQAPKRVPMTDPGYDQYVHEKLQYEALKGGKGS